MAIRRRCIWAARTICRWGRRLVFFLKSKVPQKFPRNQNVEVAAADSSFHTTLSLSDGSLMLEDASTALGTVEPLAKFRVVGVWAGAGARGFGRWSGRGLDVAGNAGAVPGFKELRCPHQCRESVHADGDESVPCELDLGIAGF